MSYRAVAWLAWSVWALCVALAVLAVLLTFPAYSQASFEPQFVVLAGVPLLVYPTIGALVVSRRPSNAVGWIVCGMGFIAEVLVFAGAYTNYTQFAHPLLLPGREIMRSITPWSVGPILILGVVLLLLLFPDGKLPTFVAPDQVSVKWLWRTVAWMAACGAAFLSLWWLTWPGGAIEALGRLGGVILNVSLLASVFSVFVRWRGAEGRERQQLKWFAYGAALFAGSFLFVTGAGEQTSPWAIFVIVATGFVGLPVTVGIAMLKYRLYDIDIVINRTLVYGSLTAALVLVYFGSVVGMQRLLSPVVGEGNQLAVVASTLLIAALFSPLRRSIQAFIDRSFYRKKYDTEQTLASFSAKLRDETDLGALNEDLVGVVKETMQPAHVSLWLRPDAVSRDKGTGQKP